MVVVEVKEKHVVIRNGRHRVRVRKVHALIIG